jgi:uncharacterized protein YndB with AHSA1/START domain
MAEAAEANALEREIRIEASPETVYEYFVEPELMMRWMGEEAELDPRPGGGLRINVDGAHVASGKYVELVPHERIVFTWGWEGPDALTAPGSTTVEVTLVADHGATVLRLVHRDLPSAELVARHSEGWDHYLERLEIAPTGTDPGPDPWAERETA